MFSDLNDDDLYFFVAYEVGGEKYTAECRVSSRIKSVDFPSYEHCDVLECLSVELQDGSTIDAESWELLLLENGLVKDFWDKAIDRFVLYQIAITTMEPGNA